MFLVNVLQSGSPEKIRPPNYWDNSTKGLWDYISLWAANIFEDVEHKKDKSENGVLEGCSKQKHGNILLVHVSLLEDVQQTNRKLQKTHQA